MTLPFLKRPATAHSERQYLFAVEISPGVIKTAIWSVINDKTQVLAVSSASPWDDKTSDSLINATDTAISDATSHLDPSGKVQIEQVIFGLNSDWVSDDKIHSDKLHLLKELSTKLDLKAVGFVVTTEAIVKFIAHTENVPPTAILLGFWPQVLEVALVRMGKIDGVHFVKKSTQMADDTVEGLSRFPNVDVFPSRMLLYDSGLDLEEIKQLLLQYPWQNSQKKLPFLHFPKIEILPPDFTVRAIALAGGTEVARAIGILPDTAVPDQKEDEVSDLGFVTDADIQDTPPSAAQPIISQPPSPPLKLKKKFKIPHLPHLPRFSFPKINFRHTGLIILAITVTVCGGLFAAFWFIPKAEVTLFLQPKDISSQFSLKVDTKASSPSLADLIIPGQVEQVSVSDSKSVSTSGSKLTGDKAKGSVTIANTQDSSKTLPSGTVLTSPSGIQFVLSETVTVASASGSAGNLVPGKATAEITASSIGSDSNLSAGTVFKIVGFSSTQMDAKNDTALSGGSSRQVKAVSKDDIAKLRADLTASVKDQAKAKLIEQISSDKTVIDSSINLETTSEDFDHKLDDQADNLSLKLAVKAQAITISKSDLKSITDQQILPLTPQGYKMNSEPTSSFTAKKTDRGAFIFAVDVSGIALPDIDKNSIIKNVVGKSPADTKDYLQSVTGISKIDILISPRLPTFFAVLPHVSKNITITVLSSR